MSKHNYTNPAFCQNSEFYPTPTSVQNEQRQQNMEAIYNRSLNINYNGVAGSISRNPKEGPLRIQRSMSTRSFVSAKATMVRQKPTPLIHATKQHHNQNQLRIPPQQRMQHQVMHPPRYGSVNPKNDDLEVPCNSGRYALVPIEDLPKSSNNRYAIVPGPSSNSGSSLSINKRYAKSQENLDYYSSRGRLKSDEEPHSFHEDNVEQFTSLPPVFDECSPSRKHGRTIKHAFSSDFGSKSFLIVDKNSNQRYQMVPTAEDEELVDDNQEIIQMHNGKAHRYAVIPADDEQDDEEVDCEEEEEETCLSTSDLNQSQNFLPLQYENGRTPMRTSTPQKTISMTPLPSYPNTPLKNPAATRKLHEILSTPPRKMPQQRNALSTPRSVLNEHLRRQQYFQSQQIYYAPPKKELSPQRLHYETVKPKTPAPPSIVNDRTTAIIIPRVAGSTVHHQEEDCSSLHAKSINNSSYPQKVVNATITLAIVSLILVLGSVVNTGLIIYMIGHFGKSFYLQFSLVAAICGVGLGFLGFRSRQCEWLPNRSYTSGYILVTVFCLLKCCGLLVILVLNPYPGFPLHDITTGVILGLATFTMFFIGLGVIGSVWCYRPPPDNRVNVV